MSAKESGHCEHSFNVVPVDEAEDRLLRAELVGVDPCDSVNIVDEIAQSPVRESGGWQTFKKAFIERTLSRRAAIATLGALAALPGRLDVAHSLAEANKFHLINYGSLGQRFAVKAAMHLHGSSSEGPGSYQNQLDQLQREGFGYAVHNDHKARVFSTKNSREYVFSSFNNSFTWSQQTRGTLSSKTASIVTTKDSSGNTVPALRLQATSTGSGKNMLIADGNANDHDLTGNIQGRALNVPVVFNQLNSGSSFDVTVTYSFQSNPDGDPEAVMVTHSYGQKSKPSKILSNTGIIYEAAPTVGKWSELNIVPSEDIAALFGGRFNKYDLSIQKMTLTANVSNGSCDVTIPRIEMPREDDTVVAERNRWTLLQQIYTANTYTFDMGRGQEPGDQDHVTLVGGSNDDSMGTGPMYAADYMTKDDAPSLLNLAIKAGSVLGYAHPFTVSPSPDTLTSSEFLKKQKNVFKNFASSNGIGSLSHTVELFYDHRGKATQDMSMNTWYLLHTQGKFKPNSGVMDEHSIIETNDVLNRQMNLLYSTADTLQAKEQAYKNGEFSVINFRRWPDAGLWTGAAGSVPMGGVMVNRAKQTLDYTVTIENMLPNQILEMVYVPLTYGQTTQMSHPETVVETLTYAQVNALSGLISRTIQKEGSYHVVVRNPSSTGTRDGISNMITNLYDLPPQLSNVDPGRLYFVS